MINLRKFDPNWDFAQDHGKSVQPGFVPSLKKQKNPTQLTLCPCCYQCLNKIQIPICQHSKELSVLGNGIPIFYNFIKICFIMLVLQLIIHSTILLHISIQQNKNCQQNSNNNNQQSQRPSYCSDDFLINLAFKNPQMNQIIPYIRILSFIALIFFCFYFRNQSRNLNFYYDQRNCTLSDYTLIISNLPLNKNYRFKLKEFISVQIQQTIEVQQIILSPEIDNFIQAQTELDSLISKKSKLLKKGETTEQIEQQILKVRQKMRSICKVYNQEQEKDQAYVKTAFIILNTDHQKMQVLQKFQKIDIQILKKYFGKGAQKIFIRQSKEARQIIWKNIKYLGSSFLKISWKSYILSFFLISSTFGIFYFLIGLKSEFIGKNLSQSFNSEQELHVIQRLSTLVVFIIIIVHLFNKYALGKILHYLTLRFENWPFHSQRQYSFALKNALGLFLINAVIALVIEGFKFRNYIPILGLIQQETLIFLFHATLVPLLDIINPEHLIKLIKRKIYFGDKNMTQKSANQLMENLPYNIGDHYSQVVSLMWFNFLYSSFLPIGNLFSLSSLVLYYWINKYTLLRRSSLKNHIDSSCYMDFYTLLEFIVLMKPLGQIITDYHLRSGPYPHSITMFCIAFIYLILPKDKIIDFFIGQKFHLQPRQYRQVKDTFDESYRLFHPISRYTNIDEINHSRRTRQRSRQLKLTHYYNTSIKNIFSKQFISFKTLQNERGSFKFVINNINDENNEKNIKRKKTKKDLSISDLLNANNKQRGNLNARDYINYESIQQLNNSSVINDMYSSSLNNSNNSSKYRFKEGKYRKISIMQRINQKSIEQTQDIQKEKRKKKLQK